MRSRNYLASSFLAIVVMMYCSGCTSTPGDDVSGGARLASSLSELIREDLNSGAASGFSEENRTILEQAADAGQITQAMYTDAALRYQACIASYGFDIQWMQRADGTYYPASLPSDQASMNSYNEVIQSCAKDGFASIESLFSLQQDNPGLYADQYEAAYMCVNTKGDYLSGMTLDDFRSELQSVFFGGGGRFVNIDISVPDVAVCLNGNGFGLAYPG